MKLIDATYIYVAYKPCGCMVGAATDCGDKDTADYVGGFIKSGYTVQRINLEDYRKSGGPMGCKCGSRQLSLLESL